MGVKPLQFNKKFSDSNYLIYLTIPSEKGRLYIDLRSDEHQVEEEGATRYVAYTSHFFDRYKERLGITGQRIDVVKEFIRTELKHMKSGSSFESFSGKIIYNLRSGLGLGVESGDLILIKTFISENEINSFQERKKQELEEMILLEDAISEPTPTILRNYEPISIK